MSNLKLNFLKNCANIFKNHPVLNLHIQTEISQETSRKIDHLCKRCAKVLTHKDEVKVETKGKRSRRNTKLVVICSLCGGIARSVVIKKRPAPIKKAEPLPKPEPSVKCKKRKRNKDTNAGLVIPASFKKSKGSQRDNKLLQLLQEESKTKTNVLDKFFM